MEKSLKLSDSFSDFFFFVLFVLLLDTYVRSGMNLVSHECCIPIKAEWIFLKLSDSFSDTLFFLLVDGGKYF